MTFHISCEQGNREWHKTSSHPLFLHDFVLHSTRYQLTNKTPTPRWIPSLKRSHTTLLIENVQTILLIITKYPQICSFFAENVDFQNVHKGRFCSVVYTPLTSVYDSQSRAINSTGPTHAKELCLTPSCCSGWTVPMHTLKANNGCSGFNRWLISDLVLIFNFNCTHE